MPAGSKRMLPRIRKWADYGICLSCFDKWKYHSIDGIKIVKSEDGKLCGVGRMPRHLRT